MENQNLQRDIKTSLQINGPILSFVKHPESITVSAGQTVTFTGVATAVFPTQDPANPAVGLGTIAYRWYEVGGGALVDDDIDGVGGSIAGAGSTYLHINSPQAADRGKQYYLTADYISNYPDPVVGFGTTTPVTPNATNDPISSDSATLELHPEIVVTKHPENAIGGEGVELEFEVGAHMTFGGFGDVSYQWRLDGENLNDGSAATGITTSFRSASETVVANIEESCVFALPLWNGGSGSNLDLIDYSKNKKTIKPGTTTPSWSKNGYGGGGTPSWETDAIAAGNFYGGAAKFDKSESEYLNFPTSADFDFGTGDFCFELWMCHQNGSSWEVLMNPSGGYYGEGGVWFAHLGGTFLIAGISGYQTIGNVELLTGKSWASYANTWNHVACTRENGKVRFFWNGKFDRLRSRWDRRQYGSPGGTNNSDNAGGGYIGMEHSNSYGHTVGYYYYEGYMQDLKIYKGVSKYTTSFTPSRVSIVDTKNGITYSDYTTISSVRTSVSAEDLFDGNYNDYVYLWTDNNPEDYIECDFSSLTVNPFINADGGIVVVSDVSIYVASESNTSGKLTLTNSSGSSTDFTPTSTTGWQKFSWTGTLAKVKIVANTSGSNEHFSVSALKVDDLVLLDPVDTVSTFTSGFPATLAIPFWNGSGEDALTLKDASQGNHKVEKYNAEPKWSSTGGKWYSGYALFNEDSSPRENRAVQILKEGKVTDFNIGTGDFTVECWVYPFALGVDDIFSTGTYLKDQLTIRKNTFEQLEVYWNDTIISSGGAISLNVWQNIAVSRKDGYVMLYIDGVRVARSKFLQSISANVPVLIGAADGNSFNWRGGIQDFVVYNNIAKYTENFVVNPRSILSFDKGISGISGSKTNKVTITPVNSGANTIDCLLTNPYASSVVTDSAIMVTTEPRGFINIEAYDGTSEADLYSYNLDDEDFTINADNINSDEICLYAPERDMEVEMDLYGAKGDDGGSVVGANASPGGEGGFSRIQFTMKKNEEYVLKGIKSNSALFLYRKASLIAVAGQGGSGRPGAAQGDGGPGGGVNIAGGKGIGSNAGQGGARIEIGALGENGRFGSRSGIKIANVYPGDVKETSPSASVYENYEGQTIKCSKGIYWREQGKGPCEDLGSIQYRIKDGTTVTNSATIDRGFKSGYAINTTGALAGDPTVAGFGGNGAVGGTGGGHGSGGGGGSGYSDGSIEIIRTGVGGNEGKSRINMRLASETLGGGVPTGFYVDDQGRILIFSCATHGKDPRTLKHQTGKVMPGTNECIDDARWQKFKNLASDGIADWRLTGSKSGSAGAKRTKITGATPYNMYRMMSNPCGGGVLLRDSLTDWYDTNYAYLWLTLAFDETSGDIGGSGSDYSTLSWSPANYYGFGFYGHSRCRLTIPGLGNETRIEGHFTDAPTVYGHYTAEFWILPPGVPDF